MYILYCALDVDEFNKISSCKNANEIWHTLVVTDEALS